MMKNYFKQLFKILVVQFVVSAVVVLFVLTKRINTDIGVLVVNLIAMLPFIGLYVLCLYSFRKKISTKTAYYITNSAVWATVSLMAVIFSLIVRFSKGAVASLVKKVYTFGFCQYKIFHFLGEFTGNKISITASAVYFSLVLLVFVLVVPLFVKKKTSEYY